MYVKRVWRLFLIDFRILSWKMVWMFLFIALVFFGSSFLMGWVNSLNVFPPQIRETLYVGWDMFLFGLAWCVMNSFIFHDVHHHGKEFYLLLPASSGEKFLSKLLSSMLVYPAVTLVILFVFSLLGMLIMYYLTNTLKPIFFPFHGWLGGWWLFFFAVQAWFFWGSIAFSHLSFVKTVLILFGVSLFLSFLTTPLFQLLFGTVVSWNGIVLHSTQGIVPESLAKTFFTVLLTGGRIAFFLSAFLAYWLSYRRFVRYEETHGV